jgi:hypothetical protein
MSCEQRALLANLIFGAVGGVAIAHFILNTGYFGYFIIPLSGTAWVAMHYAIEHALEKDRA